MAVRPERFRELFGSFPTSVSIVTTLDEHDQPAGFTCNAVSAVSMDPALLLVCVARTSRTLRAITRRGAFVLNLLADGGQGASEAFAGKSGSKFAGLRWVPSRVGGGLPVLVDVALAYAECVVEQEVEAGDHLVLIARVEAAEVFPRAPLLYYNRGYLPWQPVSAAPQLVPVD